MVVIDIATVWLLGKCTLWRRGDGEVPPEVCLQAHHFSKLTQYLIAHRIVDRLNDIIAEVKFFIFGFGTMILCTGLFQAQQVIYDQIPINSKFNYQRIASR